MRQLIILSAVLLIISARCLELGTGKSVLLRETSNEIKSRKAILLDNGGNATTDNSLQVSVLNYGAKVSDTELGNTFTVDSNHGAAKQDTSSIEFRWLANDTLQITYDQKLRTFIQRKNVNGVTVLYQPK